MDLKDRILDDFYNGRINKHDRAEAQAQQMLHHRLNRNPQVATDPGVELAADRIFVLLIEDRVLQRVGQFV